MIPAFHSFFFFPFEYIAQYFIIKKVWCLGQKVFLLHLGGANVYYFLKEVSGCLCGHPQREPREKKDQSISFVFLITLVPLNTRLYWGQFFFLGTKRYCLDLTIILWVRDQYHLYYTTYRIDGFIGSKSKTTANYFNYKFSNSM